MDSPIYSKLDSRLSVLQMYDEMQHKLETLQSVLKCYHQLFKPWPPPDDDSLYTMDPVGSAQSTGNHSDVGTAEMKQLSSTEKADLDMFDKLLTKAKKARENQKRVIKNQEQKQRHSSRSEGTKGDISNTENQNLSEKVCSTDNCDTSKNNKKDKPAPSTFPNISTHHPLTAQPHSSSLEASAEARLAKLDCSKSSSSLTVSTQANKTRSSSASSKKKHQPVHIKAPFQTNPSMVSKTYKTTTYSAATMAAGKSSRNTSKSKGDFLVSHNSSVEKVVLVKSISKAISHTEEDYCNDDLGTNLITHVSHEKVHHINVNETKNVVDRKYTSSSHVSKTDSLRQTEIDIQESEKSLKNRNLSDRLKAKKESDRRPDFNILANCAKLCIPTKLKQLHLANVRLRMKFLTENVTKKVNQSTISQELVIRLKQQFDNMAEQEIVRKLCLMTNIYKNLTRLINNTGLDHLSENSSTYEILRVRKIMEFLLITFQDLEEQAHNNYNSYLTPLSIAAEQVMHIPKTKILSAIIIPNFHIPGHPSPKVVFYRSRKELERYRDLLFWLQNQRLQMDSMDTAAKELIPLLHSLNPASSEFLRVLRASYDLLIMDNKHCPVVVKDTIQDPEEPSSPYHK